MPREIRENAKVALLSCAIESKDTEIKTEVQDIYVLVTIPALYGARKTKDQRSNRKK